MFATRVGNSENSWQQMCSASATSVRPPRCSGQRDCLRHTEETAKKCHPRFTSVASSYTLLGLTSNQGTNAASIRLLLWLASDVLAKLFLYCAPSRGDPSVFFSR